MTEKIVKIKITGDEKNLIASLSRADRKVRTFGNKAVSSVRRGGRMLGRGLAGLAGIGGGYALIRAGKQFMDFEERLVRLGIQAETPIEEIMKLKEEIHALSTETGQDRGDLLAGVEAIVERTGNLEYARDVLEDMGKVATATGAHMADVGATTANLFEKGGLGPDQIIEMYDIMISQGKRGAFTLNNLAAMMERISASSGQIGTKGIEGFATIGAWMQMIRKATGSPEQATTSVEGAISDILSKRRQIQRYLHFDIKDQSGEYKPVEDILKGVIAGTGGDQEKLLRVFGRESARAFSFLTTLYKDTGGFEQLNEFLDTEKARGTVERDFRRYMRESTAVQGKKLGNEAAKLLDTTLTPVMGKLADVLDGMNLWIKDIKDGKGIFNNITMDVYFNDKGWSATKMDKYTKIQANRMQVTRKRGELATPATMMGR